MKSVLYAALVLGLVPIQTTLLNHVSILGIRPDLALVAACLVGFFGGELDGLLLGFFLGWSQDLLSADVASANVVVKAGAGFLAGLAGRHLAHMTPFVLLVALAGISCVSSLASLYSMKAADWLVWPAVYSQVLVQGFFDAAVGTAAYWLFLRRSADGPINMGSRY